MRFDNFVIFIKQMLGYTEASIFVKWFVFLVGLIILITGLMINYNFGVLILYAVLSSLIALAQFKNASLLVSLILFLPILYLIADAKFYEVLYMVGSLLIGYSFVMKINKPLRF